MACSKLATAKTLPSTFPQKRKLVDGDSENAFQITSDRCVWAFFFYKLCLPVCAVYLLFMRAQVTNNVRSSHRFIAINKNSFNLLFICFQFAFQYCSYYPPVHEFNIHISHPSLLVYTDDSVYSAFALLLIKFYFFSFLLPLSHT